MLLRAPVASGTRIGSCRIVRQIGVGGMGAVYEAQQEPFERRVALKVLHTAPEHDAESIRRFFNEARASTRIEHPSIVQIYEYGHADDGTPYIVMELLSGETLSRRIQTLRSQGKSLSPAQVLRYGWQIADALAAAHDKGIIHRDLKPDNVMITQDRIAAGGERIKLLDFGIAKLTKDVTDSDGQTAAGRIFGTAKYMSPEQCVHAGAVDGLTDVYALGVMLFEMLAGRSPFLAEGTLQLCLMHMTQPPPSLLSLQPTLPEDIAQLVHRLLSKEPSLRPSMASLATSLEELWERERLRAVEPSAAPRPAAQREPAGSQVGVGPSTTTTLSRAATQNLPKRPRLESAPRAYLVPVLALFAASTLGLVLFLFLRRGPARQVDPSTAHIASPTGSPTTSPPVTSVDKAAKPAAPAAIAFQSMPSTPPPSAAGQVSGSPPTKLPGAAGESTAPQVAPPKPASVAPRETLPTPPSLVRPAIVHWSVRSAPEGAQISDAQGRALGVTPWEHEQPTQPGQVRVFLRRKGYQSATVELRRSQDEQVAVTLRPQPTKQPGVGSTPRPPVRELPIEK